MYVSGVPNFIVVIFLCSFGFMTQSPWWKCCGLWGLQSGLLFMYFVHLNFLGLLLNHLGGNVLRTCRILFYTLITESMNESGENKAEQAIF